VSELQGGPAGLRVQRERLFETLSRAPEIAEAYEVDAAERLIRGGGPGIQGESPFDLRQRLFLAPQGEEN
jgi:hypothetical protein